MTFKPMLAATATVADIEAHLLKGPLIATPKLDGIRCLISGGRLLSRSLKPIPNFFINERLAERHHLEGLDGELMVGPVCPEQFQVTTSGVMRESGEPDFSYLVFDYHDRPERPYFARLVDMVDRLEGRAIPHVEVIARTEVSRMDDLLEFESNVLKAGFEGLILRKPASTYKFGRSTVNEGGMLKLKRFEDSEAVITGFEPEMLNTNLAVKNELGRTKRSSAKSGMVAKDRVGNLFVRDDTKGWSFSVSAATMPRVPMSEGPGLIGRAIKYKYFPIGVKDGPRFPVALGMRDARDMSS